MLYRVKDYPAGDLAPWRGDYARVSIEFPDHVESGLKLVLAHQLGTGEDHGFGALHLVDKELAEMGFESFSREDGEVLFRFPYDSSRHFQWVPCGLLYAEDVSGLPPWHRIEPLRDGWYFFWEP